MAKKIRRLLGENRIDCACLIHDTLYDWTYVDRLYNSLCRNLTPNVEFHVYTESNRSVPKPFRHHVLEEWPGIRGPKQSWWYKVQLFNPEHYAGHMLYFDLDTVIAGNLDWIWQCDKNYFWAARDFKYLFRSTKTTINSSVMWFNVEKHSHVYLNFNPDDVRNNKRIWHGDQDYIHSRIPQSQLRYFDHNRIKSWRWQAHDGGYNFKTKKHANPGSGTDINNDTSVLVFHGKPKPHEVEDTTIERLWK